MLDNELDLASGHGHLKLSFQGLERWLSSCCSSRGPGSPPSTICNFSSRGSDALSSGFLRHVVQRHTWRQNTYHTCKLNIRQKSNFNAWKITNFNAWKITKWYKQTALQDEVITAGGSHSPARLPTTVCYFHDEFYFLLMFFGDGGCLMQPRMALSSLDSWGWP